MGDEVPTTNGRFSIDTAKLIAAEIKSVIATSNLHVLCEEGTGEIVPLEYASDKRKQPYDFPSLSYGWHPDAEQQIAEVIFRAVRGVVRGAEGRALEFVSTDAIVAELKHRSDLFFLVMTPVAEEAYDWRRSYKGGHAYPLLGFVKMNLDALSVKWGQEAEMVPVDGDDDNDEGEEGGEEGSPGHEG